MKFFYSLLFLLWLPLSASNWDGTLYHKANNQQIITAQELLSYASIKPHEAIADLCCGTGEITAYLASLVPQGSVMGVDFSTSMLELAQKKYNLPNLIFKHGDITNWQLSGNYFDRITAFSCLHWIEYIQDILVNCHQSLKPNGIFMAAMAHIDHFLYKPVCTTAQDSKWSSFFNDTTLKPWYPHNADSIAKLLEAANLEPVVIKTWYKKTMFNSKQSFIQWVKAWITGITHLKYLPSTDHEIFIHEALEKFLETVTFQEDGSFSFLNPILLVIARKA